MKKAILIFILLFAVNVQAKETDIELTAGYIQNTGNTEKESLHSSFKLKHEAGDNELSLYLSNSFGKSNGIKDEEKYTGSMQYDRLIFDEKMALFGFGNFERDTFKKSDYKINAGGGAKFIIYKKNKNELSVSGAMLYELDKRFVNDKELMRISIRPKIKYKIFESVLYYQMKHDYSQDYTMRSESSITIPMGWYLSMRLAYIYDFDNSPANGVNKKDTSVITSLVAYF